MCMALALFNHLSGVSVITFYSTTIFKDVNMTADAPIDIQAGNLCLSLSRTFGALIAVIPFRYLPRRFIFISGHLLMGVCMGLAYYFVNAGDPSAVVACLSCFMGVFQSSMGSGYFMYIAEVGSEPAMGLSLCTVMLCSITISATIPSLISLPGVGVVKIMLMLAVL